MDALPDFNKDVNLTHFVLDPLSVIVKLAIISNKPIGTKFRVHQHNILIQETGLWQSTVRMYFGNNKTEIQYLYNPIFLACCQYLSLKFVDKTPNICKLFKAAIKGLENLKETYKSCPIIVLCLNYYICLVENHLEQFFNETLFKNDMMTPFYKNENMALLASYWNSDRIKIVLDIIEFLHKEYAASNYVQSLEIFMNNTDADVVKIFG